MIFVRYFHIVLVIEKNTNILRFEISGSMGYEGRFFNGVIFHGGWEFSMDGESDFLELFE